MVGNGSDDFYLLGIGAGLFLCNFYNLICMLIFKEFIFDVVYFLFKVLKEYKCCNLYGYIYWLKFFLEGDVDLEMGWVVDFGEVKKVWKKVEFFVDY